MSAKKAPTSDTAVAIAELKTIVLAMDRRGSEQHGENTARLTRIEEQARLTNGTVIGHEHRLSTLEKRPGLDARLRWYVGIVIGTIVSTVAVLKLLKVSFL